MPPGQADLDGQLLEQLAAIRTGVDECRRYLGGIYGILQQQEGISSTLSELGPMVMGLLGGGAPPPGNGSPGPHTHHTVIEATHGD